ncbi:hypothetical protein OAP56_03030 [Rickettsiaceae bacterium]|nr:hypothetical protein [Rickettsiaceae bacterium]
MLRADILSFAEEVEHDKKVNAEFLGSKDPNLQEAIVIYRRVLHLIGSGDMKITDRYGASQQSYKNELPVSFYMRHSSYVFIEVPASTGDKIINWLSTGKKGELAKLDKRYYVSKNWQDARVKKNHSLYEGKPSSRNQYIKKKKDQFETTERRGRVAELCRSVSHSLGITNVKYFSLDLVLDNNLKKDSSSLERDYTCLYINYIAPTEDKHGAMLIGFEKGSGSNFHILADKHEIADEDEYQYTIIPRKCGGMNIKLDKEQLNEITNANIESDGEKLSSLIQATSVKEFIQAREHITPTFQGSKTIIFQKKPNFLKNILNNLTRKVSFGVFAPYKKEFHKYERFKAQEKITIQDGKRIKEQFLRGNDMLV